MSVLSWLLDPLGLSRTHVNYELDLSQITAPPTDDLTFEIEQAEEPVAVEASANPQALARRAGDTPSQ